MIATRRSSGHEGFFVKPVHEVTTQKVNVGPMERWLSLLAGTAIAVGGLRRRSAGGLLAALGGGYLIYRGQRGQCSLYRMMGCEEVAEPPLEIREQMTVACAQDEAYRSCKDLRKLSCVVRPEAELRASTPGRWLWKWTGPGRVKLNCEVELAEDRPNDLLAWQTLPESWTQVVAELHFLPAPSDRGTEIHLRMEMAPAGGLIGHAIARALKPALKMLLRGYLRRLKSMLETGEVATNAMRTEHPPISTPRPQGPSIPPRHRQPLPAEISPATAGVDPVEEASMESFPASDPPAR